MLPFPFFFYHQTSRLGLQLAFLMFFSPFPGVQQLKVGYDNQKKWHEQILR